MSDYGEERMSEEDLRHLEDEQHEQGPQGDVPEDHVASEHAPRDGGMTDDGAADDGAATAGGSAGPGGRGQEPLWRLRSLHSSETWYASWGGPGELAAGLVVVAPTRYGRDLCTVQGLAQAPGHVPPSDLLVVDRVATAEDLAKAKANEERERKAFETCRQKIDSRRLPMKLVTAHYLLEEQKILFFFSAESRVDFRELVKDLVSVFKMRIELRQIGVRDEARITGGSGVCGRVLCCHGVSDKLTPVSIKMAKDQNLSLNSMKISGPCGRLLCCLAYEYGFYRDARRELPGEGVRFPFEDITFRVIEVNALGGSVKASGEDGRVLDFSAARFIHSEGRWKVREEQE